MYVVEIKKKGYFNYKKFSGFEKKQPGIYTATVETKQEAKDLCRKAKWHFMFAQFYDEKWSRSTTYRGDYMKGLDPHARCRCVYCGKIDNLENMVIDHIIPVAMAKESKTVQRILEKLGYESINDVRNLVPACNDCNTKKGRDYNIFYSIRAKLGGYEIFWYIYWGLQILIIIFLIYLNIKTLLS